MNRRAVIYARISVTSDESVSIDRQLESARQFAAARGAEVVGQFVDEGVSATRNKPEDRPGWSAMLAHAEPYDEVIVWKIDRVARRIVDFWDAIKALETHDRSLVSIGDNLDMSTTIGQIVAGVLAGFAQMEAEATRDRVSAARRHLLNNGRLPGGTVPYGWKSAPNPDGPGFVLAQDPERIEYVRGAVERVQAGATLYSVKQWLDESDAPLPTASQSTRKQATWSYVTLDRMIRNPVLAGMTAYNPGNQSKVRGADVLRDADGLPVVDESVAIMSVAEWRAMIASLDNRDSPQSKPRALKSKTSPLLSGLIWCGDCERRMWRGTVQKREAYSCPGCHQTVSNIEDHVIAEFLAAKGDRLRLSAVEEVYDAGAEVLPEIEHRLAELGAQLQETDDDEHAERLEEQMRNLRHLRREARARKPVSEWKPVHSEQTYGEDWAAAETVADRRAVLDDALEVVEIRRGRVGRGLDPNRFTFKWKFPEEVGPIETPNDATLAAWAKDNPASRKR